MGPTMAASTMAAASPAATGARLDPRPAHVFMVDPAASAAVGANHNASHTVPPNVAARVMSAHRTPKRTCGPSGSASLGRLVRRLARWSLARWSPARWSPDRWSPDRWSPPLFDRRPARRPVGVGGCALVRLLFLRLAPGEATFTALTHPRREG